jgi:hypothetical protein
MRNRPSNQASDCRKDGIDQEQLSEINPHCCLACRVENEKPAM